MKRIHLHVKDCGGTGTPVVMVHGFPLTHESFEYQFEALRSDGLRPVAYDRRGFGSSEKGIGPYDYDTLADDLEQVLADLDLHQIVLLGFSMGGGEVARYVSRHGEGRLQGLVFAGSVTPYLSKTQDNPAGPLDSMTAQEKLVALQADRDRYFEGFVNKFYEVSGKVVVDKSDIQKAIAMCQECDQDAAIACMTSFSSTDFRDDLTRVTIPTLIIHGDSDAIVPFEGSGKLTHAAIRHSELELIRGGPHGINVSHADQFNDRLLKFVRAVESVRV
ncbi:alpha/beta fold hydrolase [Pirellulaceae bacterium SH501]